MEVSNPAPRARAEGARHLARWHSGGAGRLPEADGRPEAASSGALLAEENGGAPDDQGTAFCSAAAMPPSGNPYDGECQSKAGLSNRTRFSVLATTRYLVCGGAPE